MGLSLTSVSEKSRSWMNCMLCFNTIVAILALIGTGLISAGIVMLLMNLGLPDED